jgi:hypothetical protein
VSLQSELAKRLNVKPRIKMGWPGSLDVIVDGRRVYSYQDTHRLPTVEDILRAVQQKA